MPSIADENPAALARFVYELGQLKLVRRSGWWAAGIKDPETVAEHSFRTAVIGYLLATRVGRDPHRVAAMCIFHDAHEARIHDINMLAKRYLSKTTGAADIFADQAKDVGIDDLVALVREFNECRTPEAQIARDADRLECLVQALEYKAQGWASVQEWIDNAVAALKTREAKDLAVTFIQSDPTSWWNS